jgi:uncharacterized protein (TIGR03435 family)
MRNPLPLFIPDWVYAEGGRKACRISVAVALFAISTPFALGQPAPPSSCSAPATAFDVASVKPSQVDFHSSRMRGTADTITATGSLFRMLANAYDLRDYQVAGGPDWIRTAAWDVVAKTDQPMPDYLNLSNEARGTIQRLRIQAVLAQRFALTCHFEMKEFPVYNLVLSKGGPKPALIVTTPDAKKKGSIDEDGKGRQNQVVGRGVELSALATTLSYGLGRNVIDKTGLTGLYDFTLTYTSDPDSTSSDDSASGATIYTALQEQLGLKLEPSKGLLPVLIIDHIDRPSAN